MNKHALLGEKCLRPHIVVDCMGREGTISTVDGTRRTMYGAFLIKPYHGALQTNVSRYINYIKSGQYPLKDLYKILTTEVMEPNDPSMEIL